MKRMRRAVVAAVLAGLGLGVASPAFATRREDYTSCIFTIAQMYHLGYLQASEWCCLAQGGTPITIEKTFNGSTYQDADCIFEGEDEVAAGSVLPQPLGDALVGATNGLVLQPLQPAPVTRPVWGRSSTIYAR